MIRYGDFYNAHQQARFMRPDAHRWMRPDAARWSKPPHPDEEKYSPSQPRDWRGRWTDGGGASGSPSTSPIGHINFGDLPNFSDLFGLFQITPGDGAYDGITGLSMKIGAGMSSRLNCRYLWLGRRLRRNCNSSLPDIPIGGSQFGWRIDLRAGPEWASSFLATVLLTI